MIERNTIAIITDGESVQNIRKILRDVDIIIAADGGANLCRSQHVIPDYIIGDIDSITLMNKEFFSESKFIEIKDQNHTDLQKALNYALLLNPTEIRVISAFGKRTDHTLSNILIFQNYNGTIPLKIFDNFGVMSFYTPGEYNLTLQLGQTVSFFSLSPIKGLSLQGFKYPVVNADYSNNFIGISNAAMSQNCTIRFQKGKLILYIITV